MEVHKSDILFCFQDAEERLEQKLNETRSELGKRNEEIEQKVKEVDDLRELIKTSEQDKFQELDKVRFFYGYYVGFLRFWPVFPGSCVLQSLHYVHTRNSGFTLLYKNV